MSEWGIFKHRKKKQDPLLSGCNYREMKVKRSTGNGGTHPSSSSGEQSPTPDYGRPLDGHARVGIEKRLHFRTTKSNSHEAPSAGLDNRSSASAASVKFCNGHKYELSLSEELAPYLARQIKSFVVDGERYVEYSVLAKVQFC